MQGLDSTTAMHLLQLLRQLSQGGRAIVTTIHQPSSRLYQQLDKLLLLSQVSCPVRCPHTIADLLLYVPCKYDTCRHGFRKRMQLFLQLLSMTSM